MRHLLTLNLFPAKARQESCQEVPEGVLDGTVEIYKTVPPGTA